MDAAPAFDRGRDATLLDLPRLARQGLPMGSFSYSRGLEAAVQAGWICDETARKWP